MPSSYGSHSSNSLGEDDQPGTSVDDAYRQFLSDPLRFADQVADPEDSEHIVPTRLLKLAISDQLPTHNESLHIRNCSTCRKYWVAHLSRAECSRPQTVPEILRREVFVDESPIAFRDGLISRTSWQFGLIQPLREFDPVRYYECIDLLVRGLVRHLRSVLLLLPSEDIVLAAYGQLVASCAEQAANVLRTQGFRHISVVPVHGAERLRFGLSPATFIGSRVICLSDVVHSGRVLKRMRTLSEQNGAKGEVYLLAFIRQATDSDTSTDFHGLWTEPAHQLWTYEKFIAEYPEDAHSIRCFEPELGLATEGAIVDEASASFLVNEDCLKFDAVVDGSHHLVAADTLTMLGVNSGTKFGTSETTRSRKHRALFSDSQIPPSFNSLTTRMADKLCEVLLAMEGPTCIVVHDYEQSRSMKIAAHLNLVLHERGIFVPIVGVGMSTSCHLCITKKQARALNKFRSAIVLDSAMRTGASLSAMWLAISETAPHLRKSIAGLVVVASKLQSILTHLNADSSMVVHSVVQMPMLPPTESLAIRISEWKNEILNTLAIYDTESSFPELEELVTYCREDLRIGFHQNSMPQSQETSAGLVQAVSGPVVRRFLNRILLWPRIPTSRKRDVVAMLVSLDDYAWLGQRDWLLANRHWLSVSDQCQHWKLFALAIISLHFRTLKEACPLSIKQTAMGILLSLRENLLVYRAQQGLFGEHCWRQGTQAKAFMSLFGVVEYCILQGKHLPPDSMKD